MSKLLITVKFFGVWLYNFFLSPAARIATINADRPPEGMIYFFIVMMFVPELCALLSKTFRDWIRQGIENSDGKLNKSDLKDMVILYGSLWCLRVFLFMSWAMIFYKMEIPFHIYTIPLLGSFGISGLPIMKSLIGQKN